MALFRPPLSPPKSLHVLRENDTPSNLRVYAPPGPVRNVHHHATGAAEGPFVGWECRSSSLVEERHRAAHFTHTRLCQG